MTDRRTSLRAAVALVLLVLLLAVLPGGIASAYAPDDVAGGAPKDGNTIVGAATSLTTGACGTHTWVSPSDGVLRVNLVQGSLTDDVSTSIAKLVIDGQTYYAFCTDLAHGAPGGRTYCLDQGFFSDWRVAWLVSNYPPSLSSKVQQAARQAAVWHFTDGWDLDPDNPVYGDGGSGDGTYDADVLAAYDAILAAIPASIPPEYTAGNVQLSITPASDVNFLPGGEAHSFTVTLTKGSAPLAGHTINVSVSGVGALDQTLAVTDGSGQASFTVTSAVPGTASITASAAVTLPAGSRFVDQLDPAGHQRLVLGEPVATTVTASATKRWVDSENVIIVHKYGDLNFNGVQDAGEPNLAGWQMSVANAAIGTYTGLTDADGNVYFDGLITANGDYVVSEIMKDNWLNSTPTSQTRARSDSDPWTQWSVSFGNARLSIIRVTKFLDIDGDGVWDDGEPVLPGWQFDLSKLVGSVWEQYDGDTTGADGTVAFTNLANGTYRVTEREQPGFVLTTPLGEGAGQVVIRTPGITDLVFGNRGVGSIVGVKYSDADGDGVRDEGEALLAGWTIELQWCPTGTCEEGEWVAFGTTATGTGGAYSFSNLPPGLYRVREVQQAGWEQTAPTSEWQEVALTWNGQAVVQEPASADFGNQQLGGLDVTKTVEWGGRTPVDRTFEVCITGPSFPLGTEEGACKVISYDAETLSATTASWSNLLAGEYSVAETDPNDYDNDEEYEWALPVVEYADGLDAAVVLPGGRGSAAVFNQTGVSTAVELKGWSVVGGTDSVDVAWTTLREEDIVEFRVYRSAGSELSAATLAASVAAQGSVSGGYEQAYSLTDAGLSAGTYNYWLVEVDADGNENLVAGPTTAVVGLSDQAATPKRVYVPLLIG